MTVTEHEISHIHDAETREPPRIYVACLSAYNKGTLHGEWIDADQDSDNLLLDIQQMLAASPEWKAEEWVIHDYEGFGRLRLDEAESLVRISAIAAGIVAHGEAFSVWLVDDPSRDPQRPERFLSEYRGEWRSVQDYAMKCAESELPTLAAIFDDAVCEASESDLALDAYGLRSGRGTVYVFEPGRD